MFNKLKQITQVIGTVFVMLVGPIHGVQNLPRWQPPYGVHATPFQLGAGKGAYKAWGREQEQRVFFSEFLPALFERTVELENFDPNCTLLWIFTGAHGGFTVTIDHNHIQLHQRFYDSMAFEKTIDGKRLRHPELRTATEQIPYQGPLEAVTVKLDHKLGLSVELNGRTVSDQKCLFEVNRHQLRLTDGKGQAFGKLLKPQPTPATLRINPAKQHQTMLGFGGIATPTAYAQLSPQGKRRWWRLVCEYNLLIQREYPIGRRLNREMNNWDRLEDATPHYYGDNFPNGEISDFDYLRTLRRLGGKVWFEFWALPPWVGDDPEKYAEAMVRYCQVSKEKAGSPPDVVGIQNEKRQTESMWHKMTLTLREKLDRAGFNSVRIHMSDAGRLSGGIERAKAFRNSSQAWATIDYAATHMYDYQDYFTNPDGFDSLLTQWKQLTHDKPFISTELCINSDHYQCPTYRIAFAMGQLYHKNLVLTDAVAICYCWTLLNVQQPSYGWTRTLFVPDRAHGFIPKASSHQLRVFGAYSRRIREGMVRVDADTDANDLLVSAFAGKDNTGTAILLNRSTKPRLVQIIWPGVTFTETELADPYHENDVRKAPTPDPNGRTTVTILPGAILTLTNVPLGQLPEQTIEVMKM